MRRDPTSEKSDLDNFKMVLFGNGDPEEFLLFVCNFNMALEVSGTFKSGAKIQYIFTLVHGEILHRFDVLSAEVEGATPVTLASIVLVLVTYFFLLMRSNMLTAIFSNIFTMKSLNIRLLAPTIGHNV